MSEHINLAEVPVELRNLTGARVPYRALYSRVLDGDLSKKIAVGVTQNARICRRSRRYSA
jgi:hypothetical protein